MMDHSQDVIDYLKFHDVGGFRYGEVSRINGLPIVAVSDVTALDSLGAVTETVRRMEDYIIGLQGKYSCGSPQQSRDVVKILNPDQVWRGIKVRHLIRTFGGVK